MKSPVILRVFKDNHLVEVKQFEQSPIVIGQDAEVQLDLKGDGVSSIHCLIEMRDNGFYICDLGSQSGTFKNGQAVLDSALTSGDEITVGPFKIVFYFGIPKPGTNPGITHSGFTNPGNTNSGLAASIPKPPPPPESNSFNPPPIPESGVNETPPKIPNVKPKDTPSVPAGKSSRQYETKVVNAHEVPSVLPENMPTIPSIPVTPPPPPLPSTPPPVAKSKPEIKGSSRSPSGGKRKRGQTYAPPSAFKNLRDLLRPSKGPVIEVIVAWRERILTTYHFKTPGIMRVGPGEDYSISLPENAAPRGWPLIEISNAVRVAVGHDMGFELVQTNGSKSMEDTVRAGKSTKNSNASIVRLEQNEMICLSMNGGNILLFIRFVPHTPVVPLIPGLLLTGPEMTAVVMSFVLIGLLAFYISATSPYEQPKEDEDLTRTAQIIFNAPTVPPPQAPAEPTPPPPKAPEPVKQKIQMAEVKQEAQKKGDPTKATSPSPNQAGKAVEVAPIPNAQNRPKKFTSTKMGGAIKLGEKAGANAQSPQKDLSRVGIFSAFGSGGSRSKLDTSYSGAGEILGQADKATGASGMDSNRAGDDLGSRFKDTGAGGKGTATEGISGIGTKGRSTGQGTYGTTSGFGDKTNVAVDAGGSEAAFDGTIDKEAVRRVVRHHIHEIRGCYQKELNKLERGQRLEGKVVIAWEIVERGIAKNVKVDVAGTTLKNKNIENCIRDRLASWIFPNPPANTTAEVKYPFYFKPER